MGKRLEELDSLRGLAALSVVIHHYMIALPVVFDDRSALPLLKYTPIHIFWAGREAVIFFFVLSGFVLSLPFFSSKRMSYASFLAKRICRIYIPYLTAIGFGILAMSLVSHREIFGLSSWVGRIWQSPLDSRTIYSHALLVGTVNNDAIDPVIWSLVHEMRISLIFPLLMLPVIRFDWRKNLLLAAALAVGGYEIQHLVSRHAVHWNDYGTTVRYASLFTIGALLAKHRMQLSERFALVSTKRRYLIGVAAIMFYTYPWWFWHGKKMLHSPIIDDTAIAIGVSCMITFALVPGIASSLLRRRIPLYLGRVAYSLYLYHAVILLASLHLLYGSMPIWTIWLISFTLTIAACSLSYYATELPSINVGRFLAEQIRASKLRRIDELGEEREAVV